MATARPRRSAAPHLKPDALRVLHVAAEWFPLVKTGGLADVVAALPDALRAQGVDARLLLPGYPALFDALQAVEPVARLGPAFGAARIDLLRGTLPGSTVPVYLIDAPWLYGRAGNPYFAPDGREWSDALQRFALLGWTAAQMAEGGLDAQWSPEVVHAHDWHAALAPAYLAAHGAAWTPARRSRSVLTLHNLAYQGHFGPERFADLQLPPWMSGQAGLEFHGSLRVLKGGLMFADCITTVSPTYAREILTPQEGHQLDGVLQHRAADLHGILNGIDDGVWNPATDAALARHYDAADLRGKRLCRDALQDEFGLQRDARGPLMVVVSRLTHQKGLDLLLAGLPHWLDAGGQLAMLGTGDAHLEQAWQAAARHAPGRVGVFIGYDEAKAHRMIAGADLIAVPSRFEPCGLTQLYGLRYGTLPLVHRVGGLADTVIDADPAALREDRATGFAFSGAHLDALTEALQRACVLWREPAVWQQLMRRAMAQDTSWRAPAAQYAALYSRLCASRAPQHGATLR